MVSVSGITKGGAEIQLNHPPELLIDTGLMEDYEKEVIQDN